MKRYQVYFAIINLAPFHCSEFLSDGTLPPEDDVHAARRSVSIER